MRLKVRAHLNSKKARLEETPDLIHAYLTKPSTEDKANKQLLLLLKKKYGSCHIISGSKSKNKIIEIQDQ